MFKLSLPVKLLIILGFSMLVGDAIPLEYKQIAYSGSLLIQEVLVFVLPVVIFSYLFSCILQLKSGAIGFVLALLTAVCLSNWLPLLYTYGIGYSIFDSIQGSLPAFEASVVLEPKWKIEMPGWISNDVALFSGLILGSFFAYFPNQKVENVAEKLKEISHRFLSQVFLPVVPLFILGFAMKLQHEGTLSLLFKHYGPILLFLIAVEAIYIVGLFGFAARFNFQKWAFYLRNVLPSAVTGFSTMSSAATMPVTLEAAEKNCDRPDLARVVVPAIGNIHMIGDSITITLIAFFIMASYGKAFPDFASFLSYSVYFILARFAVAGVPGGGILVILPLLERYFDFTTEMLSLITAMYIILDTLNTVTNVSGTGAFAILFSKFYAWLQSKLGLAVSTESDGQPIEVRTPLPAK